MELRLDPKQNLKRTNNPVLLIGKGRKVSRRGIFVPLILLAR